KVPSLRRCRSCIWSQSGPQTITFQQLSATDLRFDAITDGAKRDISGRSGRSDDCYRAAGTAAMGSRLAGGIQCQVVGHEATLIDDGWSTETCPSDCQLSLGHGPGTPCPGLTLYLGTRFTIVLTRRKA